jgi:lysophospholipase L1-like esterase
LSQPASPSPVRPITPRVRPRRLWAFRLAALAFSLVLALALAELALRVILTFAYRNALESIPPSVASNPQAELTPSQLFLPDANPLRHYTLRRGVRGVFMGAPVEISSAGLRDDEFIPVKPADTFRVLALGDSTLFGWGVDRLETYSELLEDSLCSEARRLPHPLQVEVINAGVPGYNSRQEVETFKAFDPGLNPDVVLIQFDRNDIEIPYGSIEPDYLRARCLLLAHWRRIKDGSLFDLRAFAILGQTERLYAETPQSGWIAIKHAYRELHALCRARGIPLYVVLISEIQPRLFDDGPGDPTQDHMLIFCQEEGIPVIESRHVGAAVLRRMNRSAWTDSVLSLHDPHPNALGHAFIAQAIFPTLHAALLRRAGEPARSPSLASGNIILCQLSRAGMYRTQRFKGERAYWIWRSGYFDFIPETEHLRVHVTVGDFDISPELPLRVFARVQGLSTPQAPQPEILKQFETFERDAGAYALDFNLAGLIGTPLHFSIETNLLGPPPARPGLRGIRLDRLEFLPAP